MSYVAIKNKIKSELQEITTISVVADYPTTDFQAYPAAVVRSDEKTGDYETTSENYEEYTFTVFLLQNIEQASSQEYQPIFTPEKCREIIEELVDTVSDHFDQDEFMAGLSLPGDRVMLGIRPTDSSIFEEESGKYAIGSIKLVTRISKTI